MRSKAAFPRRGGIEFFIRAQQSCLRLAATLAVALVAATAGTALAQEPKLTLLPDMVLTGPTDRLSLEAPKGIDVSKVKLPQISISPDNDVRSIKIIGADTRAVAIAIDLAGNAKIGKREVKLSVDGKVLTGTLDVIQGPAIVVEWPGAASQNKKVTSTLTVQSRAGLDLSKIEAKDIAITPKGVSVVEVTGQSADALTVGLNIPSAADRNAVRTLKIGRDINMAANFSLATKPHAPKACAKLQHCCEGTADRCTVCRPLDQVCKK